MYLYLRPTHSSTIMHLRRAIYSQTLGQSGLFRSLSPIPPPPPQRVSNTAVDQMSSPKIKPLLSIQRVAALPACRRASCLFKKPFTPATTFGRRQWWENLNRVHGAVVTEWQRRYLVPDSSDVFIRLESHAVEWQATELGTRRMIPSGPGGEYEMRMWSVCV